VRTLILAAAIAAIAASQADTVAAAGSWTAAFKGLTFVRLELRTVEGRLGGTLVMGDIEVDKNGDIRQVKAPSRDPVVLFDVVQQGARVTFAWKDGTSTDRFELRMLDGMRAELRLIPTEELRQELAADGLPLPKPIVLTRH